MGVVAIVYSETGKKAIQFQQKQKCNANILIVYISLAPLKCSLQTGSYK
jgi:hypothetical protein